MTDCPLDSPTPLRLSVRTLRCDLEAGELSAQLCADPHLTAAPELLLVQSPTGVYRLTLSGLQRPCVTNLALSFLGPLLSPQGGEASEVFALALFPSLRRSPLQEPSQDEGQPWPVDRPLLTTAEDVLRLTGVEASLSDPQAGLALRAASEEIRERLLAGGRRPEPSEANQRAVAFTALALLAAAGHLPGHDPDQLWDLGEHWAEA